MPEKTNAGPKAGVRPSTRTRRRNYLSAGTQFVWPAGHSGVVVATAVWSVAMTTGVVASLTLLIATTSSLGRLADTC